MNKILFAFSTAAMLCGACSNLDQVDDTMSGAASFGDEVKFSTIAMRSVADDDPTWDEGDGIGIFVDGYYTNKNYEIETVSTGDMKPATDEESIYYLADGDEELSYYAYYPYSDRATTGKYSVSLNDQSDLNAISLLYATATSNSDNVQFKFNHQLAKVSLSLTTDNGEITSFDEEIKVKLCNVGVASTFDLATGEFSEEPTMGDIEAIAPANSAAATTSAEFVVLPQSDLSQICFMVYYDGRWWQSDFGTKLDGKSWESGGKYNYSIKVTTLEVSAVTDIIVSGEVSQIGIPSDEPIALTADVYPLLTVNKGVVWSSSDETVATVDQDGLVTGLKVGTAMIRATSTSQTNVYGEYEVTVAERGVAIGDYLYSDMSWGVDPEKDGILGVIYSFEEGSTTKGKIINLKSESTLTWIVEGSDFASTRIVLNIRSDYNWGKYSLTLPEYGMDGIKAAYGLDPDFSDFPSFKWVSDLNAEVVDYSAIDNGSTGVWYLPGEACFLVELLPNVNNNPAINKNLSAAGGDPVIAGWYISSSELPGAPVNNGKFRCITYFDSGTFRADGAIKTSTGTRYTRAVMSFDMNQSNN